MHRRLFHQIEDLEQLAVAARPGDAVLADLVPRHLFERDHRRRVPLAIAANHAPDDVALGVHADDRVAERDHERLVADK